MSKKILLLTQWFDPEPTFKGLVFARELVKQGFDVEVLTGFPNYPSGRIYSGYKLKLVQKEVIDGVKITRVPLYASHDSSALKRIFNYGSFAFSALIYGLFFAKKPDVIYAYHPPLTTGLTAALLRMFRRSPVVYDIQDMWPDTLKATGMLNNQKILTIIDKLCNWLYKRIDQIIVLSPGFKRLLVERGVPVKKIEVIYNWADEVALTQKNNDVDLSFFDETKFNIVFAGNMGKAQALNNVLSAAEMIQKEANSNIKFIFIGGGLEVESLKTQAVSMGLTNTIFVPPVSMAKIGSVLQKADALLVHLKADPLFEITIPSKTQAYMSVGKPILMAVNGDAADLIKMAKAGVVVPSEQPKDLTLAILELAKLPKHNILEMGSNAKKYYQENLSVVVGIAKFTKIFNKLIVDKNKP